MCIYFAKAAKLTIDDGNAKIQVENAEGVSITCSCKWVSTRTDTNEKTRSNRFLRILRWIMQIWKAAFISYVKALVASFCNSAKDFLKDLIQNPFC